MLRQLIEERRASQETHKDMLGCLMRTHENRYKLSDEEIIDLIITLLYSGYETVSTTSMMAVKYLHDHPRVLDELRVSDAFLYFDIFTFSSTLMPYDSDLDFNLCRKSIWQSGQGKGRRIPSTGMTTS